MDNLGLNLKTFVSTVEGTLREAIEEQGYSVKEFTTLDYDQEDDAWWGLFTGEGNEQFCFHAEVDTGMLGVAPAEEG
jgi:hypothetical protein